VELLFLYKNYAAHLYRILKAQAEPEKKKV